MKHLLLAAVGISMSFGVSITVAQPPEPPTALPVPPTQKGTLPAGARDGFVPPAQEILLSLRYQDVDVIALLRKIAVEGNIEIIVHGDVSGKIKEINLEKVSPERAFERVVKLAGLDWKVEKKTYVVSQKAPVTSPGKEEPRLGVNMVDVPVSIVLELLSKQGDIQVSVDDDVTEKLQLIRLNNETPESAIEKIAQAANLAWRKDENNHYIVSKPKPN